MSSVIIAINNFLSTKPCMVLSTINFLSRVHLFPAVYGTNYITKHTTVLLACIMASELVSLYTPTIIVYNSTVVYSQYLALLGNTYTNRQRPRIIFLVISRMLIRRFKVSSQAHSYSMLSFHYLLHWRDSNAPRHNRHSDPQDPIMRQTWIPKQHSVRLRSKSKTTFVQRSME